ncbi:UPF0184 protein-like [Argiope bruennichi]|uniref:UPF0184 protein C9orf16 like protein n=1 Tax=Argiope bruennichi TaxID=94029 RepID=A0A8T0G012_ARGBR|nr:UPF0184 protein-like [Argiope bruennichi]KAF8796674.1 UPF0184 protein C9orf16 like protein [Argiope bruennichi]
MTATKKLGEPPEENSEQSLPPIEDINSQDADIEDYLELDQEFDKINKCLDALEKKNDSLHEELFKLLEESRQIRSELKDANSGAS